MSNISDPDGMILEICTILLCGDDHVQQIKPTLKFNRRKGKYHAIVEVVMFDTPNRTSMTKRLISGEGTTVAKAREKVLEELKRRAQAVIDMPVREVMES